MLVKTVTREDKWAVQLLNSYKQLGIVKEGKLEREISVFGSLFNTGILLNGIIDQLQYSADTQKLIVTDLKTRRTNSMPGESQILGHKLQVMIYKMLLDGLTRGTTKTDVLVEHLNLNVSAPLSIEVIEYIQVMGLQSVFATFCSPEETSIKESGLTFGDLLQSVSKLIRGLDLPPVTSLSIYYEYQETSAVIGVEEIMFDENWVKEKLESAIKFWRGDREPIGPDIEDLWKCDMCQFKRVCVWRKQKTLESSPGIKILSSPLKSPAAR